MGYQNARGSSKCWQGNQNLTFGYKAHQSNLKAFYEKHCFGMFPFDKPTTRFFVSQII